MDEEPIAVINVKQSGLLEDKSVSQDILISANPFNLRIPMKRKYYHASPKRHKPGEVLAGQSCGWSSNVPVVFMTQSPVPHYTIFDEAVKGNWFVYRVIPTSKVKIGRCWDEALSESVEIVKCVGRARELAKHGSRFGSRVFYKNVFYWTKR